MDPEKVENIEKPVDDEAELDAALAANIEDFKAGKKPEEISDKPETKVEEKVDDPAAPAPETKVEDTSTPPAEAKEGEVDLRVPNQGKFESDESYAKRVDLFDLVKRRKAATTPEAKAKLAEEIQKTKGQIQNLNGADKINNPNPVEEKKVDEDPALAADRETAKRLGLASKEDIQEVLRQERVAVETKNTLERFVEKHPEFKDEDVREVFFDFVDSNYNWKDKTGKDLTTVLELARENMFKPSETIQERVLKGANVAEKVNAMQFPGGTGGKVGLSADKKASLDELTATGMSEEKAMELISD